MKSADSRLILLTSCRLFYECRFSESWFDHFVIAYVTCATVECSYSVLWIIAAQAARRYSPSDKVDCVRERPRLFSQSCWQLQQLRRYAGDGQAS